MCRKRSQRKGRDGNDHFDAAFSASQFPRPWCGGTLALPYIAKRRGQTAEVWWTQGFVPEEDVSIKKIVADYEKASGNTIDLASCRSRHSVRRSFRR